MNKLKMIVLIIAVLTLFSLLTNLPKKRTFSVPSSEKTRARQYEKLETAIRRENIRKEYAR